MQASTSKRPSVTGPSQPLSDISSIPRPTVITNQDSFTSNAQLESTKSPLASTPEAYDFYRRNIPIINGATSQSPNGPARSFERPAFRSASGPPLSSTKSNPTLLASHIIQPKTSIKDLVAIFDQVSNGTSVMPPGVTAPRAKNEIRGGQRAKLRINRTRAPSDMNLTASARQQNAAEKEATLQQVGGQNSMENARLPRRKDLTSNRVVPVSDESGRQDRTRRQPLFGEIVYGVSQPSELGYGIPHQGRRRSSEGSMHYPNAMFPQVRKRAGAEAAETSPSGWHMDSAYPNGLSISFPPHRDANNSVGSHNIRFESFQNTPHLYDARMMNYTTSTNSPSRIPVRRPQSSSSAEPKSREWSRTQGTRPITPPHLTAPRRYDRSPKTSASNAQRMKAIVTTPVTKKSPPLRSSRPRQNVSMVSGASPKAVTADRNGGTTSPPRNSPRSWNSEFLPELKDSPDLWQSNDAEIEQPDRPGSTELALEHVRANGLVHDYGPEHSSSDLQSNQRRGSIEGIKYHSVDIVSNHMLPQLSSAVYAKPGLKLNLDMRGAPDCASEAPLTGATELTEFEEETSTAVPTGVESVQPPFEPFLDQANDDDAREGQQEVSQQVPQDVVNASSPGFTQHTVCSQIMQVRQNDEFTLYPPSESAEGHSLAASDVETIQIMLGTSPVIDGGNASWQKRDKATLAPLNTSFPPNTTGQAPVSVSQRSPTWRPSSSDSVHAGHVIQDSATYSVINRILDQYHESGVVSPAMVQEFQQHIIETDPALVNPEVDSISTLRTALEGIIHDQTHSQECIDDKLLPKPHSDTIVSSTTKEDYLRDVSAPPIVTDTQPSLPIDQGHDLETKSSQALALDGRAVITDHGSEQFNSPKDTLRPVTSNITLPAANEDDRTGEEMAPTPPPKDHVQVMPPSMARSASFDAAKLDSPYTSAEFRAGTSGLLDICDIGGVFSLATDVATALDSPTLPKSPEFSQIPATTPHSSPASTSIKTPPHLKVKRKPPPIPYSTPPFVESSRSTSEQPNTGPIRVQEDTLPKSTFQSTPLHTQDAAKTIIAAEQDDQSNASVASQLQDQRRLIKRRHLIKELVDTEFSYNQDMKVIEDIYSGTASACKTLTPDDKRILFGNTSEIVEFSETFLDALKNAASSIYVLPRANKWRVKRTSFSTSNSSHTDQSATPVPELNNDDHDRKTSIGGAFGHHMHRMEKVYGDYLRNHDSANQRLQKLLPIQTVSVWLNECQTYASDITSAWDLDSLLVKPVQRILKYPLLLKSLLEVTPKDHPDYNALDMAVKEVLDMSHRINEAKKRAELVDQVVNNRNKRKDFDATLGLSKAFGRRTEKLRQQVGLSDVFEDPEYKAIAEKFGGHFFQLQVVMRDVEMYKTTVEKYMKQYCRYVESLEGMIDVGLSGSPEIESKWRKFALTIREITAIAYADHEAALRKRCIDPMMTLLKLHEGPQRFMQKRKKRLVDYAKYKSIKDRGEKPEKKVQEQGEQFLALNDTLKDELPKLFALTAKLVRACTHAYIDIQAKWHEIWKKKLQTVLDEQQIPKLWADIVEAFSSDFKYPEAQALGLGICNGSTLADASNFFFSPSPTLDTTDSSSWKRPSRPSTLDSSKRSTSTEQTTLLPTLDLRRNSFSLLGTSSTGRSSAENQRPTLNGHMGQRLRSSSGFSGSPNTSMPSGSHQNIRTPSTHGSYFPSRVSNASAGPPPTSFPRMSMDSVKRPVSSSTYYSTAASQPPPQSANSSPAMRYSGIFSSAMPMTDSPPDSKPTSSHRMQAASGAQEFRVLFLVASLFEFNIDRARQEGGYPYLTYVPGEIFDVIGQKGELWLARNQDDASKTVGWIWEKHFIKLMDENS